MDRYWNFVAIPYFFIILAFGAWTLFNFRSVQVSSQSIASRVANIIKMRPAEVGEGSFMPAAAASRPAASRPAVAK
jgi:hypothetical protein